jgi:hypothetical protein
MRRPKPKRQRRRAPAPPPTGTAPTADDIARMMQRKVTRRELVQIFHENGFPISFSRLNKLSMPSCSEGPPIDGWWGRLAIYDPHRALKWARERYRSATADA